MRPLGVDVSGLSPQEYEAYSEQLQQFERSAPANGDATTIWKWILERAVVEPVDRTVEADILALCRTTTSPPSHTFLALLRLLTHSRSSKYLTRDHVFIQTTPLTLSVVTQVDSAPSGTNPFRKLPFVSPTIGSIRSGVFSPPASPISQASSSRSAPPLPTKRLASPPSNNPFKVRPYSANDSTPQHPRSSSSPTVPAHETPPLPPRPRSAKLENFSSSSSGRNDTPPPPPPPSRRLSSQLSSSPSISIIFSSSPVQPSSSSSTKPQPFFPPVKRTNSRTKLESTSHIGPATRLRSENTGSSSGGGGVKVASLSPRRTGSLNGDPSTSTTRSEEAEGRMVAGAGLGRSKTVGSKPIPPPPKRRTESLGGSMDPFAETVLSPRISPFDSTARSAIRTSKEFHPSSLSPASATASLTSHSTRAAKELTTALSNSSKDIGNLLHQSSKSSEEWFRGARNGIRVAGVGGGKGRKEERAKLVDSEREREEEGEDPDGDELEMQRTGESFGETVQGRRVQVEREIMKENQVGWSKLEE